MVKPSGELLERYADWVWVLTIYVGNHGMLDFVWNPFGDNSYSKLGRLRGVFTSLHRHELLKYVQIVSEFWSFM